MSTMYDAWLARKRDVQTRGEYLDKIERFCRHYKCLYYMDFRFCALKHAPDLAEWAASPGLWAGDRILDVENRIAKVREEILKS